jgi:hypothetical protein
MTQQLSQEVLSVLPYFNDNVLMVFSDKKDQEYEMEIYEKSNKGDIVFHQQTPPFSNALINKEVDILYTTKFKNVGQKVSGQVKRMTKNYILVTLYGGSEDLPDRRMDKRFLIEEDMISFTITNKNHEKIYKNIKPINISNTGFRFSYERCEECNNHDFACFKHLKKEDTLDIKLDFKPLKAVINVEGLVTTADFDENGGKTFFVGGKFNCDPTMISNISKNIREIEAIDNYRKYRTKLKETVEIEEAGKKSVGFFSSFFNKKRV